MISENICNSLPKNVEKTLYRAFQKSPIENQANAGILIEEADKISIREKRPSQNNIKDVTTGNTKSEIYSIELRMEEIKAVKPQQRSTEEKKELTKLRQIKRRLQSQHKPTEIKKARLKKDREANQDIEKEVQLTKQVNDIFFI